MSKQIFRAKPPKLMKKTRDLEISYTLNIHIKSAFLYTVAHIINVLNEFSVVTCIPSSVFQFRPPPG